MELLGVKNHPSLAHIADTFVLQARYMVGEYDRIDAEDEKRVGNGRWRRCFWYYFGMDEQNR